MTKTAHPALTEAQRAVLTAATGRPEGAVILPARLKGRPAQILAEALLAKGFVREVRAKGELPVWRKDDTTGKSFTLVLTKAGRAAVADSVVEQPGPAAPPIAAHPADAPGTAPASPAPRRSSKLAIVIDLLRRDTGASIADMMVATGWLPHTTRAMLTGLRQRGYLLTRDAGEGGSVYRIVADGASAGAAQADTAQAA